MKRNNFFTKKQYGFISGRSTALQLLEVLDKWTDALDLGYSIGCVGRSFINMTNNNGPSTEPCGIPDVTLCHADLSAFTPTL
jgi:hypothetical protein